MPNPFDHSAWGIKSKSKPKPKPKPKIIVENIIPYFNPTRTLRIKEFSFLNLERDLKVNLDGAVAVEFSDDISDEEMRFINGTISFTVDSYLYRPTDTAKLIKIIKTRIFKNF